MAAYTNRSTINPAGNTVLIVYERQYKEYSVYKEYLDKTVERVRCTRRYSAEAWFSQWSQDTRLITERRW